MGWTETFKCLRCGYPAPKNDIGAGYSWHLYECICKQLYAERHFGENGYYPPQVIHDKSIIKLDVNFSIEFKS